MQMELLKSIAVLTIVSLLLQTVTATKGQLIRSEEKALKKDRLSVGLPGKFKPRPASVSLSGGSVLQSSRRMHKANKGYRRMRRFHKLKAERRAKKHTPQKQQVNDFTPQKQQVKDFFVKGACQIDAQGHQCKSASADSCRWPELQKFDLVISWWTNKPQSNITSHVASLLHMKESRLENQAEIKYGLRSFEKHGLLDHVNRVYIFMDEKTLETYGAPRAFNYKNKDLQILTERDLGFKYIESSKGDQFLALDRIPGISDYFLWVPDDNFMMKPFKMEYLYNERKPNLFSFGTYSLGWCDNKGPVGSTHGPVLFNKCAYSAVANHYWRSLKDEGANQNMDALCLYTNAMKQFWRVQSATGTGFHEECHTNAKILRGCQHFTDVKKTPLFLNVQGNSISDEYDPHITKLNISQFMPHGPEQWFHEHYPTPSRFEK